MSQKRYQLLTYSARAAAVTGVLFSFGAAGFFLPNSQNWLVIIFKLLAGFDTVRVEMLSLLNGMDIILLALTGVFIIGLGSALWETSRVGAMLAMIQPFLGIGIFLVTQNAGRSAFMGSVIVISVVMLRSDIFSKWTAAGGILAGVLLFGGDLGVSLAPSLPLAVFFAIGYLLLIVWLFNITAVLFKFAQEIKPKLGKSPQ
jgi:hypothetical protein